MNSNLSNWDRWMTAISFAEAGEFEMARQMIPEQRGEPQLTTIEKYSMAVAFAEAGEFETARQIIQEQKEEGQRATLLEDYFMAVAFAEEGLHEEAARVIGDTRGARPKRVQPSSDFLDAIGIRGVQVTYGLLRVEAIGAR